MLKKDPFIKHNAILFAGSIAASFLNYLYYPVIGRMMNLADFGEVQTLVSMFLQATIFLQVASIVVTNIVANMEGNKAEERALIELQKLVLLISFGGFVLFILLSKLIQSSLHFSSILPIFTLAVSLLISVTLSLCVAYLRGKQQFYTVSVSGILSAGAKLVFSAALVYFGFRTFGAIAGIVIGQLITLGITGFIAYRLGYFRYLSRNTKLPNLRIVLPELKYSGFVLIVTLVVTLQFSIDMLVVKRYFPADIAGEYAGITTIARILYFLTGSIAVVLLSSVQRSDTSGNNRHLLIRSSCILLALGGAGLLAFSLMPELIITLLIGNRYLTQSALLPPLSLAIFLISVANLLLTYCLALRFYQVIVPTIAGALVTYILLLVRHATLQQVVSSLLTGSIIFIGLLSGWALMQIAKDRVHSREVV